MTEAKEQYYLQQIANLNRTIADLFALIEEKAEEKKDEPEASTSVETKK